MKIIHVMADGKILEDITGKVVKVAEAKDFYNLLNNYNQKGAIKND